MRVIATRLGYYGMERRNPGDTFVLEPIKSQDKDGNVILISPKEQFSKNWMELADTQTAPKARAVPKPRQSSSDDDVI